MLFMNWLSQVTFLKGVPNECHCNVNGLLAGSAYSLSLLHTVPHITPFFLFFLVKPHSKSQKLKDLVANHKVITEYNNPFEELKYCFINCAIYSSSHKDIGFFNWINPSKSRVSAVGIVTGYDLDDREVGVRVPVGSRIFYLPYHPDLIWHSSNLLYNGHRGLFPRGQSGRRVKLTTHLQLVPRSRKRGSMNPLPHSLRLHDVVLN
jgi:hypothetical protein